MAHIALNHGNLPVLWNVLSPQLLVQVVVPHVPCVHCRQWLDLPCVLPVLGLQQPLPPLRIRSQIEIIGNVEAAFQELLDAFPDCSELVLLLLVLDCLERDELNSLQLEDGGGLSRRILQVMMDSAHLFSLRNHHQVLDSQDVQNPQKALDLQNPLRVFPHYDIYTLTLFSLPSVKY